MDKKVEEMIAMGAAYALNCQPCMEVHRRKGAEAGLSKGEMQAAIQVAETVKKGAYKRASSIAKDLFETKEEESRPAANECCS